ncbi:hypothetical protein HNR16_001113 [Pseudoclavibacter chungangensis]|nr:hypothetical protein [Pseudoclavibacter chungangensis]
MVGSGDSVVVVVAVDVIVGRGSWVVVLGVPLISATGRLYPFVQSTERAGSLERGRTGAEADWSRGGLE